MTKPLTRRGREHLIRETMKDLNCLKSDLINDEVIDFAINLRGSLLIISERYSNDAIVDLIPGVTSVLNKLDASITVNNDLKQNLFDLSEENKLLEKLLENEKQKRKVAFEDSLCYEENAVAEITLLKQQIKNLEIIQSKQKEEIDNKNAIICILQPDINVIKENEKLSLNSTNHVEFLTPKNTIKSKTRFTETHPISVSNRYSAFEADLLSPSACETHKMQVRAQVHRSASPQSPTTRNKSQEYNDSNVKPKKKRRIALLADSQGKDFVKYLRVLEDNFDVFVYTKPGAKIKHIIRDGLCFVRDYTHNDFIIVLAGSNDLDYNQPAQLTVSMGIKSLLSLNLDTNIIINSIPFRYDNPSLNDNIDFLNQTVFKSVRNYKGDLNLFFNDVNAILTRSHFTRHGLHYNRRGKRLLAQHFADFIKQAGGNSPILLDIVESSCSNLDELKSLRSIPCVVSRTENVSLIEPYPDMSSPLCGSSQTSPVSSVVRTPDETIPPDLTLSWEHFPPLPLATRSFNKKSFLDEHPHQCLNQRV